MNGGWDSSGLDDSYLKPNLMVFNPNQIIWIIIWINELDYSYLIPN
jgi:hypothetical protein